MPTELRVRFHRKLADIEASVVRLFDLVGHSVVAAHDCLLSADWEAAEAIAGRDGLVDRLEDELEVLTEHQLLTQSPMLGDMRYLVTVLRVVPQLERCGDLAEHVAQRGMTGLVTRATPEVRGLLDEMGRVCIEMWRELAQAWVERDGGAAGRLDGCDDQLDRLHDELTATLLDADMPRMDLIQAALVGRFYERLGDHAVHIAARLSYLVSGRPQAPLGA